MFAYYVVLACPLYNESNYCRSLFSLVWPRPLPQSSPPPMLATAMLATPLAMLLPPPTLTVSLLEKEKKLICEISHDK